VLDAFGDKLRVWPNNESAEALRAAREKGTEHGVQRWQQGYILPEVTREW
jgi:hypothetical protein